MLKTYSAKSSTSRLWKPGVLDNTSLNPAPTVFDNVSKSGDPRLGVWKFSPKFVSFTLTLYANLGGGGVVEMRVPDPIVKECQHYFWQVRVKLQNWDNVKHMRMNHILSTRLDANSLSRQTRNLFMFTNFFIHIVSLSSFDREHEVQTFLIREGQILDNRNISLI